MNTTRILGLLPARGGSKGIPGKNLRLLLGKPLISWAATALKNSQIPVRKICSTDDIEIAKVAEACGLETPWLRPTELASDTALVVDVIAHALRSLDANGDKPYTHVALVQATSPTVTADDIDAAIKLAIDGNADTVITGYSAGQRHPSTMYSIGKDGQVQWLLDESQRMDRRQDLSSIFIRTGLVYAIRTELVLEKRTIYGDRILSLTLPEEQSITIDEEPDFRLAEYLLKEKQND